MNMRTAQRNTCRQGRRLIDRMKNSPSRVQREVMTEFLRDLLTRTLDIERSLCDMRTSFMDLGVDSLKAVECKIILEKELDLPLGSSLLFDYPTLESLADFLVERSGEADRGGTEGRCGEAGGRYGCRIGATVCNGQRGPELQAEVK